MRRVVERTPPTKKQLAEMARIHLYYEVAMLRGGLAEQNLRRKKYPNIRSARYDRADPRRIACMAFFEAALMHARVLNDFLAVRPNRYEDDVWAGDYIENWQAPNPGPLARGQIAFHGRPVKGLINKQLAHFSLNRLNQSGFGMQEIVGEVVRDMRTFANDTSNICYAQLEGVRGLLSRDPWETEP
jgi:hypothetical protein